MNLEIEFGIPFPDKVPVYDLIEKARAACESIRLLEDNGLMVDTEPSALDKQTAAELTMQYAESPDEASKALTNNAVAAMTPASLVQLRGYLDEFGQAVIKHSTEVRHLVANRLLEESRNPDAKVRIRALELLGKISDVGLFTDKAEVTVTHQTSDELREKLREKLKKLTKRPEMPTIVVEDAKIVNVDEEMGVSIIKNKKPSAAKSKK
jgi:hypothetical protein